MSTPSVVVGRYRKHLRYLMLGNGGHEFMQGSTPYPMPKPHVQGDADLYSPLPLYVRQTDQHTPPAMYVDPKYHLVDGVMHTFYYGLDLDVIGQIQTDKMVVELNTDMTDEIQHACAKLWRDENRAVISEAMLLVTPSGMTGNLVDMAMIEKFLELFAPLNPPISATVTITIEMDCVTFDNFDVQQ